MSDSIKEKYKYSSNWIKRLEVRQHWVYYWCQQKIMEGYINPGETILELGVGSGFAANYLRSKGYDVTTIDIDKDKNPDIQANIVEYDYTTQYNHVMAFEVLEHIPYEEFCVVIEKLRPVVKNYLFLSLPRNEKVLLEFYFKMIFLKPVSVRLCAKRKKIVTQNHHWELDYSSFKKELVEKQFSEAGFQEVTSFKEKSIFYYAFK